MAAWEQFIVHKTWVELIVNTPAFSGDLYAAMAEARQQYHNHHGILPSSDDAFEILTGNDKIIIRFETTGSRIAKLTDNVHRDLERATELLAAIIDDCVSTKNVVCVKHAKGDENGNCYHSLARDFLTNKEENPYA